MRSWAFLPTIMCLAFGSAAHGASAVVMRDGKSVAVATEDGELLLWSAGNEKPKWKLKIGGFGTGVLSRVADMALRPNGNILLVERCGAILQVSPDGKVISEKWPAYEYVRLAVEMPAVNWTKWGDQLEKLGCTAAANFSKDAQYLYLVADKWSIARKVPVEALLKQPDERVFLGDTLVFQFKDRNFTISKSIGKPLLDTGKGWLVGDHVLPTALAACEGILVAGVDEGTVFFIPEVGDQIKEQRFRQVGDPNRDTRSVLYAGCLGGGMAYTVSFDTGNGQIQLWDLKTKAAVHSVGFGSGGHPGMAFSAIASRSGKQLLSVGDGDVRLWTVEDAHLKLVAKYFHNDGFRNRSFAAAALDSGDFVFWHGGRLWKYLATGGDPVLYAGSSP